MTTRADELAREGWQRRGAFDEPKLTDVIEGYQELGFEIRLEPLCLEEEPGCVACMRLEPERYRTVYTRRR